MALLDRWEYCLRELDIRRWSIGSGYELALERELNTLGDDGWELVSAVRRRGRAEHDEVLACIFKRPRSA